MKVAAVGVGLFAHRRAAHTAQIVVLIPVRQDKQEPLPDRICLLAAETEQARGLKLAKAIYHAAILDQEGVGWGPDGAHGERAGAAPGRTAISRASTANSGTSA
jgi:hypothetical protein